MKPTTKVLTFCKEFVASVGFRQQFLRFMYKYYFLDPFGPADVAAGFKTT
jgi:hypothetical protein